MIARSAVVAFGTCALLACVDVSNSNCSWSTHCPSGQYCARTSERQYCVEDLTPPVVRGVTVTCGTDPCLRDGTLTVTASVTDPEEVLGAEATLDLDSSTAVPLARAGNVWRGTMALRSFPFERFEGPVTASVVGVNGARTRSAPLAGEPVAVTRLRWVYTASNALTSPAVMADGTAVVGVATMSDQLLVVRSDGTKGWSITAGTGQITGAPTLGTTGVWVGSRDGSVYRVSTEGDSVGPGCWSGGVIQQGTALLSGQPERVVAGSDARQLAIVAETGSCKGVGAGAVVTACPVVTREGRTFAAPGPAAQSFALTSMGMLAAEWTAIPPAPRPPMISGPVINPLALDAAGELWSVGSNGDVYRTSATGTASLVTTLMGAQSGIVFLPDGTPVLGGGSARLARLNASGWTESALLEGLPSTPLVLRSRSPEILVGTSTGRLYAIRQSDGSIAWSTRLSPTNAPLQPPNIYTPTTEPQTDTLSTAYVSGEDGKLYAVIVDGALDTSSPWPKAFHDPRNTNNAGTQP